MPHRIIRHRLGKSNIYLIQGENGYLMVDAGNPGNFRSFIKRLHEEKINPKEISLILITHVHKDHVGNLKLIKELTGAPIMVHNLEYEWLASGKVDVPNGTVPLYRFISKMGQKRGVKLKFPPVDADIKISEGTSLKEYGHNGTVIPTPGHSVGSVSLFLDNGNAFVGDVCFNYPSFKRTVFPGFAENVTTLFKTWRFLLESEMHTFYPGHGKPFGKEKIKKSLILRGDHLER